jgi:acetyl-CoA carboxylase carboxyltransferase component
MVRSPLTGVVEEVVAPEGASVAAGAVVLVVESMKMHHEVLAPQPGVVGSLAVAPGDQVVEGQPLFAVEAASTSGDGTGPRRGGPTAGGDREDLERVLERRRRILDEARPEAVGRRRAAGRRTARENVEDLVDPGTFSEYGGLALAAQRLRRSEEDLIARTPGDGMVCGTAEVGGVPCVVLAYDYTVLAGTQGLRNHRKTDRMLELAERHRLPVVLFAEGGGGRPGDTDQSELFHLMVPTFASFARLSALVPRIGIVSGPCFAGNAALLGCCDVIVATPDASIGMGGPAMIEGGGLGTFTAAEVGPVDVQAPNGVIDLVVDDEGAAVAAAKGLVGLLARADAPGGGAADQAQLRDLVPEDPKRVHDVRAVLEVLADTGSVVELRRDYGRGMLTALARLGGRAVGVIANDPRHLSGAVDAAGSDKAARFLQLCDAFGLPVVSLVDTPGFMVGPENETTAMVRRCSRMFVTAATMSVPWLAVVLRRGYGLGAMAMTGGGFHAPLLTLAWPTGEFGAMGVEGAVRLAFRRELEELPDGEAREARVRELIEAVRAQSGALTMASVFEIDDVIDPADTRDRLLDALRAVPPSPPPPGGRRRTMVDSW